MVQDALFAPLQTMIGLSNAGVEKAANNAAAGIIRDARRECGLVRVHALCGEQCLQGLAELVKVMLGLADDLRSGRCRGLDT